MKDSTYAASGMGKKRDIKFAKEMIKALQGIDTSGDREMREFFNKEILTDKKNYIKIKMEKYLEKILNYFEQNL